VNKQSLQITSQFSSEFPEPHTVASGENADLTVVQLNCQNLPTKGEKGTSYQVAVALVNQFLSEEDELSTTGHAPQAIYNRLYKEIDRLGGTILIILDEVDAIGDDDTVYMNFLDRVQMERFQKHGLA